VDEIATHFLQVGQRESGSFKIHVERAQDTKRNEPGPELKKGRDIPPAASRGGSLEGLRGLWSLAVLIQFAEG